MHATRLLAGIAAAAALLGCAGAPPPAPEAGPAPGTLKVRGGRFTMGRDAGEINERPAHRVDVDGFAMDRTEVPAEEFAVFLNAAGNPGEAYVTPDDTATVVLVRGRDDGAIRFTPRPGFERFPANNVSWAGADAFCRWRGKRLPTEAEWEKAARGTDQRLFPWGPSPPRPDLAQFGQSWQERGLDVLVPVDTLAGGASPYGLLNMAGNVLEWVSDWYRQNLCDFCNPEGERNLGLIRQLTGRDGEALEHAAPARDPDDGAISGEAPSRQRQVPPRDNPTGPAAGSFKVLRGGSWRDGLDVELATTRRFWLDPAQRFAHTGFRCVAPLSREDSGPSLDEREKAGTLQP